MDDEPAADDKTDSEELPNGGAAVTKQSQFALSAAEFLFCPGTIRSRSNAVVDDEPLVCESVRRMLDFDGHQRASRFSAFRERQLRFG